MSVKIHTSRYVRGKTWAARNPDRADDLWVVVWSNNKRERIPIGPPTAENRARAEAKRESLENALRAMSAGTIIAPTLKEAAAEYLRIGMKLGRLAATTQEDRTYILAETGPILRELGDLPLDQITHAHILRWWEAFVVESGRAPNTGRQHLSALAGIYDHAMATGVVSSSPINAVRTHLRRGRKTKEGRAESASTLVRPIEPAADLARLVAVALDWRAQHGSRRKPSIKERRTLGDTPVIVLLALDAGMRLGEVWGLRWESIWLGGSPQDTHREIEVRHTIARGAHETSPKSGRTRRVELSARLRRLLRERWMELGKPAASERVLVVKDMKRWRSGSWARLCEIAEVGKRRPKDLRDSYASYLISAGVPLAFISGQLGHAGVHVTSQHYARWVEGVDYRVRPEIAPHEVAADLLARVDTEALKRAVEGDS